jgi:flagellin-like hook-associated protein FlgL
MTRITTNQMAHNVLLNIGKSKLDIDRFSKEVSTGIKVSLPGDSNQSGTIAQLQSTMDRSESYKNRIIQLENQFGMEDSILTQSNNLLLRAKGNSRAGR